MASNRGYAYRPSSLCGSSIFFHWMDVEEYCLVLVIMSLYAFSFHVTDLQTDFPLSVFRFKLRTTVRTVFGSA